MLRKLQLVITAFTSFAFGGWLAVFVPIALAERLRLDSNWFWLAPGWGLLKPGRDDGTLILWATVISALCYSILIAPMVYFAIRTGWRNTD